VSVLSGSRQELRAKDRERNNELRKIKKYNAGVYRKHTRAQKKRVPENQYKTRLKDPGNVLEIDDLHTYFFTDIGTVRAVDGVTINIPSGKTIGVVGESGCGKSVTSLSIMRLLQEPQGQIVKGALRFNIGDGAAIDLARIPMKKMNNIRGSDITMIFQEPMTTLNPVLSIGRQLDEVTRCHNNDRLSGKQIKKRSVEMLKTVGIANSDGVYRMYPHELSGGMRQRVVIALALLCNPKLIIADEPTTALDVTIQAQILELLRELKDKISASILFITHDLGVISETADNIVVMYAGRIVEQGTVRDIFTNPSHPYTIGLMKSRPEHISGSETLYSIPGNVPSPVELPDFCYFRNRCNMSLNACRGEYPPMIPISDTHSVACHKYISELMKGDVADA
jgi:peptide/nickel transport system ATP-binding protein